MDDLLARHRKELKDLQGKITQKKKQASKKTRKGVNDECDRLEADLKAQHHAEIVAINAESQPQEQSIIEEQLHELQVTEDKTPDVPSAQPAKTVAESLDIGNTDSGQRKPNRQKARLARREADREEAARQAAEEASNLPDMKQQERDRMLSYMSEHKLHEKEIRADGHCLYSAVADQLEVISIPLGHAPDMKPELHYKITRNVAADYIQSHGDDFAGFLEEPLDQYVHKVRDTAEWGGQLELQALAKAYSVHINVLQDFGRVEKIEPDGQGKGTIWLGYYKHGFGLGEHYNSLRRQA